MIPIGCRVNERRKGVAEFVSKRVEKLSRGGRTHLLNKVDTSLQVHTEIDEGPFNVLLPVLLLFLNEHVVVEELLQTLVRVVYADLFETVFLKEQ